MRVAACSSNNNKRQNKRASLERERKGINKSLRAIGVVHLHKASSFTAAPRLPPHPVSPATVATTSLAHRRSGVKRSDSYVRTPLPGEYIASADNSSLSARRRHQSALIPSPSLLSAASGWFQGVGGCCSSLPPNQPLPLSLILVHLLPSCRSL